MNKPYSEACEQNREPILSVLKPRLQDASKLLEIGSGTGQHAVYFAPELPELHWQPSDRSENLSGIQAWLAESTAENIRSPIALNVIQDAWPDEQYDAVYSANTAHIMGIQAVEAMFVGVSKVLNFGGLFLLYGPFNYNGAYTSESNARFDQWLKDRDPHSGIKDFDDLTDMAIRNGLQFEEDLEMPVNNRILVWKRV